MLVTSTARNANPLPRNVHPLPRQAGPFSAGGPAQAAILGQSRALELTIDKALRMAPTAISVLVTGESGTGKELFARLLHERGPAPDGPFVAVNCGALSRELAESELFGHERGAFTGAADRRMGWFEEASGGTLVLDEVGELPLDLQPKLLRVLETGRLRRVGGRGEIAVKVRVVALTLRDLAADAAAGRFRVDLYHRLAGFELRLPPLRVRREDLAPLADSFVAEAAAEIGGPRQLSPAALARLREHDWPGNVRELRNVIRRAAFLSDEVIDAADLDLAPRFCSGGGAPVSGVAEVSAFTSPQPHTRTLAAPLTTVAFTPSEDRDLLQLRGHTWEQLQRYIFIWALREIGGSRRRAARALGISRSTFCDRVKRLNLEPASG